jgi:hypothetical protein
MRNTFKRGQAWKLIFISDTTVFYITCFTDSATFFATSPGERFMTLLMRYSYSAKPISGTFGLSTLQTFYS